MTPTVRKQVSLATLFFMGWLCPPGEPGEGPSRITHAVPPGIIVVRPDVLVIRFESFAGPAEGSYEIWDREPARDAGWDTHWEAPCLVSSDVSLDYDLTAMHEQISPLVHLFVPKGWHTLRVSCRGVRGYELEPVGVCRLQFWPMDGGA